MPERSRPRRAPRASGGRDVSARSGGRGLSDGGDGRGVTTALNYVLLIAIVTLMVSGLLVGVSELVYRQQDDAVRSQLDTVGNDLAGDIGTAERLVGTHGGDQVRLETRLPETVGGSQYRAAVTNASGEKYNLVLRSDDPDLVVSVPFRSSIPVNGTASGGTVVVTYDAANDRLVIDDA